MRPETTRLRPLMKAAAVTIALLIIGAACASGEPAGDLGLIPVTTPPGITLANTTPSSPLPSPTATAASPVLELAEIPVMNVSMREWRDTNFRRILASVDPREFFPGGPPKNGIQPIYEPLFISIQEAELEDWLTPDHPVVVIEVNGDARAYPLGIITFHEIVNDTVGGEPIVISYCPLCYTALGFKRTVDGQVLAFGTTGNLRNSNLVMWDDVTESWWQQTTGEALLGDMAGIRLEFVSMFLTSMEEFKQTHPEGTVLSVQSGPSQFRPFYGRAQYNRYDSPNNQPFFFYGQIDGRLNPVERILGLKIGETAIAFPFSALGEQLVTEAVIEGQLVVVFWKSGTRSALDLEEIALSRDIGSAAAFDPTVDGKVLTFTFDAEANAFRDTGTGSSWSLLGKALAGPLAGTQLRGLNGENGLWFSWASFQPETLIYAPDGAAR